MRETIAIILGVTIAVLLGIIVYQNQRRFHKPLITTPYQRVTLQNGLVYYGRIDHLGTDHPVLRDALSVREDAETGTRERRYVVTKRKDEANGADHMILPAGSIAHIEPVRPDSAIGKAIQQALERR